ncbi:cdc42-interacting protein 4 [Terrapene carolina triunguis]|uniref:cdc42-interacting protein 4 n=1 Tax=Terrapene triunguis TaxID=2587831 RepID=UPI0011563ECE|nr:cdc42-interacting protein 4 [Terrapene carolina triunguis]
MDWGTELWDQFDDIERHTQWGLDLMEKYVKFVKERTEIEQAYAKQLRFCQYQAFLQVVKELNDFAGQREVVAENLTTRICVELSKHGQELKQERKSHFQEGRRAQQQLENSFKQLENSKRKFERDCREAEKAMLAAEKLDQDLNATKADVEKAKQQANLRSHMAEESKNEYASFLQKFNRDQSQFYFLEMPQIFNKLQEMDERRTVRLKEGYGVFSETERQVMPIIGKCLDGMKAAADSVNEKNDSQVLIELHKSGFERPGDVDFEDFSQPINRTSSDSSLGTPRGTLDGRLDPRLLGKNKGKRWLFSKKNKLPPPPLSPVISAPPPSSSSATNGPPSPKFTRDPLSYCLNEINKTVKPRIASFRSLKRGPVITEDFSHLPPEQRRKKLQQKIEERNRELQKEIDQRDALNKMKDVYQKTPQMGDPASLEPKISETLSNIEKLRLEIQKYESWLAEAESRMLSNRPDNTLRYSRHLDHATTLNNNGSHEKGSPDATHSDDSQDALNQPIYTEFDEDFEEDLASPIGTCVAMYQFEGSSEGTISMTEGEELSLMEEDKGDGWTRVRRSKGGEGYVPTSYLRVTLN